ncbi:hypothetical protein KDH83_22175 [Achromobacter sp. Marseille-Q0513]|uniref:hypothetical protein n=1 Tax=Achromobacter sp. Marseille-Q0513 TaxID=2829161 RepID=UPI001BA25B9B|nr:hypothetical protein [Achromobacter sp. Marseille-Q0513]MBR8656021.1 hypothetical protein [Achromobacter sp. Marseille-Q0513]
MQVFKTLAELLRAIPALEAREWLYVNLDAWRATPERAVFYSIPETYLEALDDDEIYLDDEDLEMPLAVQGLNLRGWMLAGDVQYIASRLNGEDPAEFIAQVNHYREYDSFK